ncbi:thioesterase family protein [Streptomyces sp. Ncost-T10-10d]|uniref:acyl-CoA thioesterase n=1 Tax=Streptomyces sp. Ncost-T10-10d TaxID=1839774 RepID=UPI00081DB5C4|nr:acyl-CoA thioesterase [Streptomyces sp. Ncost-T10-10d]SCF65410.1 acyl-CoA thioester hydrolase [Streptomyces sp. Ncost-T10-10d]
MSKEPTKSFEVRWDDMDLNGHLRNTRYLEYAATARLAFLVDSGWTPQDLLKAGVAAVSLGEEVRYLREVLPLETVTVASRIVGLSTDGARWRFEHSFSRESGEEAAVVRTLGAWIDVRARRIAAPPVGLLTALEAARAADCEVLTSSKR